MITDRDDKIEATGTVSGPTTPEGVARLLHESLSLLAPEHGYPCHSFMRWEEASERTRELTIAAVARVMGLLAASGWVNAHTLEKPGSVLCNCDPESDSPPTNPTTGAVMDHHCDCLAVRAVAQLLGRQRTTHHRQCIGGCPYDS